MTTDLLERFADAPATVNIYPVHSVDTVCALLKVMKEQDFPVLEILARPLAPTLELMRQLNDRPERALADVGFGTIKTRADAVAAVELGPDFLVAPTFSRNVLDVAVEADIPYVPGVSTLQDIQDVVEAFEDVGRELKVLKVCPVDMLLPSIVQSMGAIYPGITYCVTGNNLTLEAMPEWTALPCVGPVMQSEFLPAERLNAGDWDFVASRLQQLRQLAKGGKS